MVCEEQLILLQMYKLEVAAYSRSVKALRANQESTTEFIARCAIARELFESCLALLSCLRDHVDKHGCGLEPDALLIQTHSESRAELYDGVLPCTLLSSRIG